MECCCKSQKGADILLAVEGRNWEILSKPGWAHQQFFSSQSEEARGQKSPSCFLQGTVSLLAIRPWTMSSWDSLAATVHRSGSEQPSWLSKGKPCLLAYFPSYWTLFSLAAAQFCVIPLTGSMRQGGNMSWEEETGLSSQAHWAVLHACSWIQLVNKLRPWQHCLHTLQIAVLALWASPLSLTPQSLSPSFTSQSVSLTSMPLNEEWPRKWLYCISFLPFLSR